MRVFFDQRQSQHAPAQELHNGGFIPSLETPARLQSILDSVGPTEPAFDHGEAALRAVHDEAYLAFLWSAWKDWRSEGRPGDAGGYVWPTVRRRPLVHQRIDARIGQFSIDAATPIAEGTWTSAYWSAQTALTALDSVLAGEASAFALCRPPGHHSGRDYLGGYCYLNSAAIAAQAAAGAGRRVAILDVDYHHGNGTQDIFYNSSEILFVSIHADPTRDYPFFWGHADETGEGEGEGLTLNLPLPHGTRLDAYRSALGRGLEKIAEFGADLVVCSYGADTFVGDPISHFALETRDYAPLARDIASLKVPTLIVMEGGYAVEALGANVAGFLSGF